MNVFGKNKIPSQIPPIPPRRPEKQLQMVGNKAGEEEEEEDQDMYERPPSEAQPKNMILCRPQEAAENAYLDRSALRRFSEPDSLTQPKASRVASNAGSSDQGNEVPFNFEAIERALKKGIMKPAPLPPPPLAVRRVSLPALGPPGFHPKADTRRDPFPSLKGDDKDEPIYVQCEPSTGSAPFHFHPRLVPEHPAGPLMHPRATIFPSGPLQVSEKSLLKGGNLKSRPLTEDSGIQSKAWYAGSCDRQTAEAALLQFNKDSAYLVRRSSGYGWNQPFTLAVLYKNHVYNIPIRYLESRHQYALGKDGKDHEEVFDSVCSIIQNYTENPLVLIDRTTSAKEQTCLLFPVKP